MSKFCIFPYDSLNFSVNICMRSLKIRKYHYVYRITNTQIKRHYYGCRSSREEPKMDLGILYFSSSKDRGFIYEQLFNPSIFKYKVIKTFFNRKTALLFEIKLHNKFNVALNPNFYNKAKQTSKRFDTTGLPSKKKGIPQYLVKDKNGNRLSISKEEYETGNFVGLTKGKCKVIVDGKSVLIPSDQYFKNKDRYGHHIKDKVSAMDSRTGKTLLVDKKDFQEKEYLIGVTSGKVLYINKLKV